MSSNFPKTISEYALHCRLDKGQSSTLKAVYLNHKSNVKVFAKLFDKKRTAAKEFSKQQFLYNQLNKAKITAAKPMQIVNVENKYALVSQYFEDAVDIKDLSSEEKAQNYIKVLDALDQCKIEKNFSKKTGLYLVMSLPYFLIKNIYYNRAHIRLLVNSFFKLASYEEFWLRLKATTLCHGDINSSNIMILKSGKVALIDLHDAYAGNKYLNAAQVLNSNWQDKQFSKALEKIILKKYNDDEILILKSFVLYNLMQRLCKVYKNSKQNKFYLDKMQSILREI